MIEKNDLVYICSPLAAPTKRQLLENMRKAREYARAVSEYFNCRAIAPHSFLPLYLDNNIPEERKLGLDFGLSLLKISKAIVVCGNTISNGMNAEIKEAKNLKKPGYILLEIKDTYVIVTMTMA